MKNTLILGIFEVIFGDLVVFNRMWPKRPPAKEERDDF